MSKQPANIIVEGVMYVLVKGHIYAGKIRRVAGTHGHDAQYQSINQGN